MEIINKIKYFYKKNTSRAINVFKYGNEIEKTDLNPNRYWKIIIFVFSFALLFSFLANFLFFWYLNRVEIIENGAEITVKKSAQKRDIFEIIDKLNQKKEIFQKLLNEKIDIQEP